MQTAYIISAQRAPVTKAGKGGFSQMRPDTLLANLIQKTLVQFPEVRDCIDDVVIGCAMQEGPQGVNIARVAALLAGLPNRTPGVSVNRLCSSGLQSIAYAAERIQLGQADIILAGGIESMSFLPFSLDRFSFNPILFDGHHSDEIGIAYGMGLTAEEVARKYEVSRESQDEFAFNSHQRALKAMEAGYFKDEILGIDVPKQLPDLVSGEILKSSQYLTQDEGPRKETSLERLSKLPPVFMRDGSVTAGNSSQVSDGAAVLLLVSEKMLKTLGLPPLARFCGFSVTGLAPEEMGMGPVKAIPDVLNRVGLNLEDMAWIELNEAFAAQSLAVMRQLSLDPERVNPCGGAIALGHPLGATGSIRAATLLHGLKRTKKRYGMVSMCIGLGMGAAGIFENLA